jgi:release factor glutamine methyltransferase
MGDDAGTPRYQPMMSKEREEKLREWHEKAIVEGQRDETLELTHLGWKFVVPPEVYPPHPLGLAEIVLSEVREDDRVLDMGTGSGVNAIAAATRSADVVAVDVNPVAVDSARQNAELNGLAERIEASPSDVFDGVSGRFDLIIFDPPFRWFRPRDLRERGTADENYGALTTFFREVGGYLTPRAHHPQLWHDRRHRLPASPDCRGRPGCGGDAEGRGRKGRLCRRLLRLPDNTAAQLGRPNALEHNAPALHSCEQMGNRRRERSRKKTQSFACSNGHPLLPKSVSWVRSCVATRRGTRCRVVRLHPNAPACCQGLAADDPDQGPSRMRWATEHGKSRP